MTLYICLVSFCHFPELLWFAGPFQLLLCSHCQWAEPHTFYHQHWKNEADYQERNPSFQSKILNSTNVTSKVAALSMSVCCKSFSVFNHILNSFVRPVSCRMIDVDRLQLNVKRWHVSSVESYNIFPDSWNFIEVLFLILGE